MISIIVTGRNDNYGGDFEDRLFATANYNIRELEKRGIEFEYVFVEWNPTGDQILLSEKVAASFSQARCFVVDGAVNRLISRNKYITLFEFHAKNVGARWARGEWLLTTNPDNFFGREILDFFEGGAFDHDTLYRAGYIPIAGASDIERSDLVDIWADESIPFCGHSGDFIFCSKSLFDRVGGFREDLTFTAVHLDSVFCHSVLDLTGQVRKIGNTFHIRHTHDDRKKRRQQYDFMKVDRTPQTTYGLSEGCLTKSIGPRITMLELPEPLLRASKKKRPVRPPVPRKYRHPSRLAKLFGR